MYANLQRPAAVANLTMQDVEKPQTVVVGADEKLVIKYKTASSYGAAKLVVDGRFIEVFELYTKYIRPTAQILISFLLRFRDNILQTMDITWISLVKRRE